MGIHRGPVCLRPGGLSGDAPRVIGEEAARRRRRRAMAEAAARPNGGVLSRPELLRRGVTRWEMTAEFRAQRWHKEGRQTVRVCAGDPALARWHRALYEVGGPAVLDGISALVAAGLRGVDED